MIGTIARRDNQAKTDTLQHSLLAENHSRVQPKQSVAVNLCSPGEFAKLNGGHD